MHKAPPWTAFFLAIFLAVFASHSWAQKKIIFNSLDFQNAIVETYGSGQNAIAVFADPFCKNCKELFLKLKKVENITIYTFLFPLEKDDDSLEIAQKIWCATDPLAVWNAWLLNGGQPPDVKIKNCNLTGLLANQDTARKNKINRTPTSFLPNGKRLMGVLTDEGIDKNLNPKKQKKKKIISPHRFRFD